MSILIKGMEMPKWNKNFERVEKILISSSGLVEWVDDNNTLLAEYEAVELPPNGDLIDRDELKSQVEDTTINASWFKWLIDNIPIVVESEET